MALMGSQHNPIAPQTLKPYVVRIYTSLYIVETKLGTNEYTALFLFDSGSDDTWLQCEGCVNCFPISGGSFNYHQSKTYKVVSCDHPLCNPKICSGNMCLYSHQYAGGAVTRGFLSSENFTFQDHEGHVSFETLIFGCGFDNRNIMFGGPLTSFNVIAGIMGMGAGQRSILSQLASQTNLRFSYCLVSWTTQDPPYSFIHFGDDAHISGDSVKTTPLLPRGLPRYYVSCTGISMNDTLLDIDPALFILRGDRSGGFAFDTYRKWTLACCEKCLRGNESVRIVIGYFEERGKQAITGEKVPYDLCYKKDASQSFHNPSMKYHFEGGADLMVHPDAVFQQFDEEGVFCLAVVLVPLDDDTGPTLLGAFQHVNYRFLFDVRALTVSFVSQDTCMNS